MKRCVYYVVGGDPCYVALLELSIKSVRRYHAKDVDVVIMCDAAYAPHVRVDGVRTVETPPNHGLDTSMRKIDLPECLKEYDAVLYLDCDIIVCAPLDPLFDAIVDPTKLYTCREGGPHNHAHIYWSLLVHPPDALETFVRNDVGVFNAGQFGFVPSGAMYNHFANIARLMKTHVGPYFVEQSFMNHYFASRPECVDAALTPHVKLAARSFEPGYVLAHFTDATLPWPIKLEMMHEWFQKNVM